MTKDEKTERHRLMCEIRQWERMIKERGEEWWTIEKTKLIAKRGEAGMRYLEDNWDLAGK